MSKLDMNWKGEEVRQILGRMRALAASNSGRCISHRIVCQLGRSDIACDAIADLWNAVKRRGVAPIKWEWEVGVPIYKK